MSIETGYSFMSFAPILSNSLDLLSNDRGEVGMKSALPPMISETAQVWTLSENVYSAPLIILIYPLGKSEW